MGWTDDRVDALRKLWLDGLSASQIAKELGGVTRNAVIGKVHRLGLSGRASPSQPQRTAVKPVRPARPAAVMPAAVRRPPASPPADAAPAELPAAAAAAAGATTPAVYRCEEPGSATVLTLGAHMCKWPIGDPGADGFSFCGRRTGAEGPYCGEHARQAYQPQARRTAAGAARSPSSELARSLRRYM